MSTSTMKRTILAIDEPREMPMDEWKEFQSRWSGKGVKFVSHKQATEAPFPSREEAYGKLAEIEKTDGPIAGLISFGAFLHRYKPVGSDLCDALPKLGFVTGGGAGFDNIDTDALSKKGVYYCNTPEAVAIPTADSAAVLILAALKHTIFYDRNTRRGQWTTGVPSGLNPKDAVLGILGMGSIGRIVSQRLQAFGMKVVYHNRNKLAEDQEGGATFVESLEDFLGQCDVVSIHVPLSSATRHLLSTREFAMFKKGARLVNTARGPVVDEDALVHALKSGHLEAVALDVFENEPKVHPYLLESDRALLQPHTGSHTIGTIANVSREMLQNLDSFLSNPEKHPPHNAVNKPANAQEQTSS